MSAERVEELEAELRADVGAFVLRWAWVGVVYALMFGRLCWAGYVLSLLWDWHVAPTFGLPGLDLSAAVGLRLTVRLAVSPAPGKLPEPRSKVETLKATAVAATNTGFFLLLGWLAHRWLP